MESKIRTVFFFFLFQETVEVQMLEMAEVPIHSEGTVLDPLDVSLFCLKIKAGQYNWFCWLIQISSSGWLAFNEKFSVQLAPPKLPLVSCS